jgi:hypothetical protein
MSLDLIRVLFWPLHRKWLHSSRPSKSINGTTCGFYSRSRSCCVKEITCSFCYTRLKCVGKDGCPPSHYQSGSGHYIGNSSILEASPSRRAQLALGRSGTSFPQWGNLESTQSIPEVNDKFFPTDPLQIQVRLPLSLMLDGLVRVPIWHDYSSWCWFEESQSSLSRLQ